jgi:hypothetical protein
LIARVARLAGPILFATLVAGCSHSAQGGRAPVPVTAFGSAIDNAAKRVELQDYTGADRILSDFALSAKGTPEAGEISFWRALYMIDPNNKTASIGEGLKAIDIYLSTPGTTMYREQAQVVKRTALALQSLRTAQLTARPAGKDTIFVNRDEEIAALKDQLTKANAELERIKKRLANPSR